MGITSCHRIFLQTVPPTNMHLFSPDPFPKLVNTQNRHLYINLKLRYTTAKQDSSKNNEEDYHLEPVHRSGRAIWSLAGLRTRGALCGLENRTPSHDRASLRQCRTRRENSSMVIVSRVVSGNLLTLETIDAQLGSDDDFCRSGGAVLRCHLNRCDSGVYSSLAAPQLNFSLIKA